MTDAMVETPMSLLLDGSLRAGLTVVTYSGGEALAISPCALHRTCVSFSPKQELQDRVKAAVRTALTAEASEPEMLEYKGLCEAGTVVWENAEWSKEFVVTGAPSPPPAPPTTTTHINLYYHGWLWPDGIKYEDEEEGATIAYPLIGLLQPPIGCIDYCTPGSLGPMREDSLLPSGGGLRATDAHVHDGFCLGSDMARVSLFLSTTSDSSNSSSDSSSCGDKDVEEEGKGQVGGCVSVCVDLRHPYRPRVRITHLIILTCDADYREAERAAADSKLSSSSSPSSSSSSSAAAATASITISDFNDVHSVMQRIATTVPSLDKLLRSNTELLLDDGNS